MLSLRNKTTSSLNALMPNHFFANKKPAHGIDPVRRFINCQNMAKGGMLNQSAIHTPSSQYIPNMALSMVDQGSSIAGLLF
jgi:hypothetical protein